MSAPLSTVPDWKLAHARGPCYDHQMPYNRTPKYHRALKPFSVEWLAKRVKEMPSGCWEWQGCRTPRGYGTSSLDGEQLVHRAFYKRYVKDPGAMCVLHKCDNPPCVNPEHLFEGTKADNNADRKTKGRYGSMVPFAPKGEAVYNARLTGDVVLAARDAYASGSATIASLAREHGVHEGTMSDAVHGRTWKHL